VTGAAEADEQRATLESCRELLEELLALARPYRSLDRSRQMHARGEELLARLHRAIATSKRGRYAQSAGREARTGPGRSDEATRAASPAGEPAEGCARCGDTGLAPVEVPSGGAGAAVELVRCSCAAGAVARPALGSSLPEHIARSLRAVLAEYGLSPAADAGGRPDRCHEGQGLGR
jgi:hypothetical protein